MASFKFDASSGFADLDIHGYSVLTALGLVNQKILECHRNGVRHLKVSHGASNITSEAQARQAGRGQIKWELRRLFRERSWPLIQYEYVNENPLPDPPTQAELEAMSDKERKRAARIEEIRDFVKELERLKASNEPSDHAPWIDLEITKNPTPLEKPLWNPIPPPEYDPKTQSL